MIGKERVVEVLVPAPIVALMIGVCPIQLFAPTAEPKLVAYVVTWHATARGYGHHSGREAEETERHFEEVTGSAIVRFKSGGRPFMMMNLYGLVPYDTRYLALKVVDNSQYWLKLKPGIAIGCNQYWSTEIVNPTENSGLYVPAGVGNPAQPNPPQLVDPPLKRQDGVVVLPADTSNHNYGPPYKWEFLNFTIHRVSIFTPSEGRACGGQTTTHESTTNLPQEGAVATSIANPPWDGGLSSEHYDFQAADPKDNSSFILNTRFSHHGPPLGSPGAGGEDFGPDYTEQVEWTAEAHRLGKCPCTLNPPNAMIPASGLAWAAAPTTAPAYINYDDPAIKNGEAKEVVDVSLPNGSETDPNGTIAVQGSVEKKIKGLPVKVKVTTCDGIPVKGETVQITVDPMKDSGGHKHEAHRPGGMLNDKEIDKPQPESFVCPKDCIEVTTDDKGYAYGAAYPGIVPPGTIRFRPPLAGKSPARYGAYESGVAGDYQITARSKQFPDSKGSALVHALVMGLKTMPPSQNYELVRGGTAHHPDGFFATTGTSDKFEKLGADFLEVQNKHNVRLKKCLQKWPVKRLSINDIALPTGGIFDWKNTWHPSHQTHNKGEGGDFNRFTDISDDQNVLECVPFPSKGLGVTIAVPFREVLLHTLVELGTKYGKWDCSDLGADVRVGPALELKTITGKQCESGEFPLFPFQFDTTLHLHVED